jgi:hypothetical protein
MPIIQTKADEYALAAIMFSIALLLAYSLANGDFKGSDVIIWSFIAGFQMLISLFYFFRKFSK